MNTREFGLFLSVCALCILFGLHLLFSSAQTLSISMGEDLNDSGSQSWRMKGIALPDVSQNLLVIGEELKEEN